MTVPALLLFSDCGGDWEFYIDFVYETFLDDIVRQPLMFRGERVSCRKHPETRGKGAGFWHMVQEGAIEEDRVPDIRRCERIPLIKYMIENCDLEWEIDVWENTRGSESNTLLWFSEEYLVVLGRRTGYWLLRTAYCTTKNHRIQALRKERDAYFQAMG